MPRAFVSPLLQETAHIEYNTVHMIHYFGFSDLVLIINISIDILIKLQGCTR